MFFMIFSLLLLSLSLLPGICLSLWSIGGEVKVELVPLLYCIFTMQVMILIYTILLLFMNVAIYFSLSFYTLSMAGLVWMMPYLVVTSKPWLLMSSICVEVVGMMTVVIIVMKEWVENVRDMNGDDGQVMERGDVKECGGYSVREREAGWGRGGLSSGQSLVI